MAGRLGEGLDLDAKQSGVFPDSRTEPRTAHEIVEQYRDISLPRRYFGTEKELGEIEYPYELTQLWGVCKRAQKDYSRCRISPRFRVAQCNNRKQHRPGVGFLSARRKRGEML